MRLQRNAIRGGSIVAHWVGGSSKTFAPTLILKQNAVNHFQMNNLKKLYLLLSLLFS